MTRFITLAGRKQVGKDTSAGMIYNLLSSAMKRTEQIVDGCRLHPIEEYQIHIVHFADALKEACALIFGIRRLDMETEEGKKRLTDVKWPLLTHDGYIPFGNHDPYTPDERAGSFMTVREVLQFVGTDLFRNQMDPDVWVKSVFRRKYGENDVVIIADARFPNECEFAKQNGLLFKIERGDQQGGDLHISERALDDYKGYDLIVVNNSDLDALEKTWAAILRGQGLLPV